MSTFKYCKLEVKYSAYEHGYRISYQNSTCTCFCTVQRMKPDPSTFLKGDVLLPLEQVGVTAVRIETVARYLHGSAGPSGTDLAQW